MSLSPARSRSSLLANLAACLLAGAALAESGALLSPAAATDLVVKYDQSQLLRMPRDVADVIIGNPTIADVSIQGGNLLVITGKSFGVTNIIALDRDRNIVQDQRVVVQSDTSGVVTVMHGLKRQTLNCAPQCNPTITVGDDPAMFTEVHKTADTKIKFSEGGGEPSPGSN